MEKSPSLKDSMVHAALAAVFVASATAGIAWLQETKPVPNDAPWHETKKGKATINGAAGATGMLLAAGYARLAGRKQS